MYRVVTPASGVGNCETEPPLPFVRGARFRRAEYVPFTIEPEGDQRTKHDIEESPIIGRNDAWDVLKEHSPRPNLVNNSGNVSPDESFIGHAESLPSE